MTGSAHGTVSRYTRGCRCSDCTEAVRQYQRGVTQERRAARTLVNGHLVAGSHVPHGRMSTYTNWHCRCDPCREAYNANRPPR